ncbi:sodium:proton antiporter [Cryobacterium roopkundense]|uniref:Sodium:proton antiporter n=1 Tax=Cryobacterium roopkundense TaxID=1001240 RepID=A0A099J2I3_9MICO|nr:DUF6328 family protein [Cryobacterium roopkundense]KGJ71757.1 sodium:proton antiporter [Cryobacterium roopkundense]MBB5641245.1 hypothetical protein [Cryobacterium roopkundense]
MVYPDHPAPGEQNNARHETTTERLDRNWNSILQELRVTQTGTQIITGFLLAAAFQTRFQSLDSYQLTVYLALIFTAVATTALGLGPVSLHRHLFHRHAMAQIVAIGSIMLRATLIGLSVVLTGAVLLIFDVVVGRAAGIVAGALILLTTVLIWLVLPRLVKLDRP